MGSTQQMFNPALENYETLKTVVVERENQLNQILARLESTPVKGTSRNFVVIAPRGMGKTHLLLLVYHEIGSKAELKKKYVPLRFAEEEYSIDSLAFFFLRLLEELARECPAEQGEIEEFRRSLDSLDNKELVKQADRFLQELLSKHEMKIVLCVDNLDQIFKAISSERTGLSQLRSILQSKDYLLLVGAAPSFFGQLKNHDKPFYNFFEVVRLPPLSDEGVEELMKKLAEMAGNQEFIRDFDKHRPKIRAVVRFTGGAPRLVRMLSHVILYSEIRGVVDYLQKLLDELTPYYQARMSKLPPQQQKIVDTMASMEGPSTPTEIAKAARMPRPNVNAQMKRLADSGFIKLVPQKKRKWRRYDISEQMFRIWREMRRVNGDERVSYLAGFLTSMYGIEISQESTEKEQAGLQVAETISSWSKPKKNSYLAPLNSSLVYFKGKNFGSARDELQALFKKKKLWKEPEITSLILNYFLDLLRSDLFHTKEFFTLFKIQLGEEFSKSFRPLDRAIEYLETKNEEFLEKLFPEERLAVEELVKRIENAEDEP